VCTAPYEMNNSVSPELILVLKGLMDIKLYLRKPEC